MLKCWQHDPLKRPKFAEIHTILPEMKPEQLKTVIAYSEAKKDHLMYRQNDIITVLDKPNNTTFWKGVLNSGKTGMFDPSNTVAYLGNSLPSSVNRDSFVRGSERTSSRRKLCPEMISGPQNDLKHTGHVGLDGAYFGDVAFLSSSSNSQSVRILKKCCGIVFVFLFSFTKFNSRSSSQFPFFSLKLKVQSCATSNCHPIQTIRGY